jgi:GT2 family glycosyltransferase
LTSERLREVLVVVPEQASESIAMVERRSGSRAVRVPSLLSFARATNLGARVATGDLLFMLNDDAAVEEGTIERLADALDAEPGLGGVGGLLVNPDGTPQPSVFAYPSWRTLVEVILQPAFRRAPLDRFAQYPYSRPPAATGDGFWLSGAALMIRRSLFAEVGGLDERYPHGVEDAVLCRAIRDRGYSIKVVPDARVVHEGGSSSYRSSEASERVATALIGGATGWIRYWESSGAGPPSRIALRAALLVFGASRLVVYSIGSLVPGPARNRRRFQRDAYVGYLRGMLSRRAHKAGGVRE